VVEGRKMRRAALLLVPLLLLACDRPPAEPDMQPELAAASVEWTEYELYQDWSDQPACLDEGLHVFGPVLVREKTVENGNRVSWRLQAKPLPGFQMVGLTSGEVWLPEPGFVHGWPEHDLEIGPAEGSAQVITRIAQWRFQNQTTGEVMSWPYYVHGSRDAAGDWKVVHVVDKCTVK
jgi:hypothetical protein